MRCAGHCYRMGQIMIADLMRVLLTFLIALFVPGLALANEPIGGLRDDGEMHTVEGEVMTIWYDSFLLYDGTGKLTVMLTPGTTNRFGIKAGDVVKVTGTALAGAFKPLTLTFASGRTQLFVDNGFQPVPQDELATGNRYLRHRDW